MNTALLKLIDEKIAETKEEKRRIQYDIDNNAWEMGAGEEDICVGWVEALDFSLKILKKIKREAKK